MKAFKVGDVVQLKSGGQKMTVVGDGTSDGHVYCQWFDATGKARGSQFPETALIKVDGNAIGGQA
jgi:uncharacterized protein YodC (DUF2158 family)